MSLRVLALEEDDVSVVLVDLSISIGPPQFLYFIRSLIPLLLQVKRMLHYKIIFNHQPRPSIHLSCLSILYRTI